MTHLQPHARHSPGKPELRVAPRRHGALRRAGTRALERTAVLAGGRAWYRRAHLSPDALVVRTEHVRVRGLPPAFDGFSLAHLSDLHGGPFLGRGDLRALVEQVNALRADACVITGDWITHRHEDALPLLEDLQHLRTREGSFAVFGNHDYHGRREGLIAAAAAARGVRVLRNERVRFERDGAARQFIELVGLEDLEESRELSMPAPVDSRAGIVELVLCHNPLAARTLARRGVALVLAGHSHGTQLDLPFLRRLGPIHPGLRLELGATTLIVSRGIGAIGLPLRIGSPAEIVCVRLERA